MRHFGYAETSPSSPQNSPEAVDHDDHSRAQEEGDGEAEHRGLHQEQRENSQRHDDRRAAEQLMNAAGGTTDQRHSPLHQVMYDVLVSDAGATTPNSE